MSLPKLRKLQAGKGKGKHVIYRVYAIFSQEFYAGKSPSDRNAGIESSMILNPIDSASNSSKVSLVSGKKRRNNATASHPKGSKVQKSDNSAKVDTRMDSAGEDMDDFGFEGAIPDGLIPQTEHTQRRQKSALAWNEAMSSLTYPLMAALHKIKQAKNGRCIEVEGSTCQSGCEKKGASMVNIISFEGVYRLNVYSSYCILLTPACETAITPTRIEYCDCISPAVALLHQGAFSSTPQRAPTWAFDIKLLEFMRLLCLYGSPNITALSSTISSFLVWQGVSNVPQSVSTETWKI